MTGPDDVSDAALRVIADNKYLVLATATLDGTPWVSPVYFAHDGLTTFWWISRPTSRHSRLIADNPQVAVTILDSTVAIGRATAVYAEATAGQCAAAEVPLEIVQLSRRLEHHGQEAWTVDRVSPPAEFRLYRARTSAAWLLPDDDGPERRIPVPLPE